MPAIGIIVIAAVVLLPVMWLIATYNNLVKLRLQCRNAWSNIDTELKRRYDLIPNLVETVKSYAKYERDILQAVTDARTKAVASTGSATLQAKDENVLIGSLRHLFAVVENYPDLKASQNFLKLQTQLVETEDRIQAARRFYNGNVRDFNTLIEMFPSNLIASIFSFTGEEFFDIEEIAQRAAPQVRI